MNKFERHIDPKEAMGIGVHSEKYIRSKIMDFTNDIDFRFKLRCFDRNRQFQNRPKAKTSEQITVISFRGYLFPVGGMTYADRMMIKHLGDYLYVNDKLPVTLLAQEQFHNKETPILKYRIREKHTEIIRKIICEVS